MKQCARGHCTHDVTVAVITTEEQCKMKTASIPAWMGMYLLYSTPSLGDDFWERQSSFTSDIAPDNLPMF